MGQGPWVNARGTRPVGQRTWDKARGSTHERHVRSAKAHGPRGASPKAFTVPDTHAPHRSVRRHSSSLTHRTVPFTEPMSFYTAPNRSGKKPSSYRTAIREKYPGITKKRIGKGEKKRLQYIAAEKQKKKLWFKKRDADLLMNGGTHQWIETRDVRKHKEISVELIPAPVVDLLFSDMENEEVQGNIQPHSPCVGEHCDCLLCRLFEVKKD